MLKSIKVEKLLFLTEFHVFLKQIFSEFSFGKLNGNQKFQRLLGGYCNLRKYSKLQKLRVHFQHLKKWNFCPSCYHFEKFIQLQFSLLKSVLNGEISRSVDVLPMKTNFTKSSTNLSKK